MKSIFSVKSWLLASCTFLALQSHAHANPEGGTITNGSATITASGKRLDIHQASDRVVIDWRSFDIESDEITQFFQPSSSAVALNRVNSPDPSYILGTLKANGNIILINPNGLFFGKEAVVDVNGLIATTANIRNDDFMNGKMDFNIPGDPEASIINAGMITAKDAGLVGLVAPNVANSGIIQARLGKVQMASADTFTLDMNGDGLINLAVSDEVAQQIVVNTGELDAAGGTVSMTAAAGRALVNSLVVANGKISAPVAEKRNGKIIIGAAGSNAVAGNKSADKGKKQGASTVVVSAHIDASARDAGDKGGSVEITGDHISLMPGTIIDASGDIGGGDIKIGGDYLGSGTTATALTNYIDPLSYIFNDAVTSGDGGRTIVWADDTTTFYGNIFARGGNTGGNGGFVETSGKKNLLAQGYVDLTAPHGNKGTYLLDPENITIYGHVNPNFVSTDTTINLAANLKLWLDSSDPTKITLTYDTNGVPTTANGTIGTKIITTAGNVSSALAVGARIRLGSAGTVATADTMGADTYTIAEISGTTITTVENLSATYSGAALHRGLVSAWADKSTSTANAMQTNVANMPLYLSGVQNGQGVINFMGSGIDDFLQNSTLPNLGQGDVTLYALQLQAAQRQWAATLSLNTQSGGGVGDPILTWRNNTTQFGIMFVGQTETGNNPVYIELGSNNLNTWLMTSVRRAGGTNGNGGALKVDIRGAVNSSATGTQGWNSAVSSGYLVGRHWMGNSIGTFVGRIPEMFLYNTSISDNAITLLNQYQSAKWALPLDPYAATGNSEAVEAMDATNGYGVFTTRYLERLSQTADISLQATQDINLDLKTDTLTLAADRNLTLTAGRDIKAAAGSTGSIITSRTTTGGNISLIAGGVAGSINLSNVNLTALNGGVVNLNAKGNINLVQENNLNLGSIKGNNISIQSTNGSIGGTGGIIGNAGNLSLTSHGDLDTRRLSLITRAGNMILQGNNVYLGTALNAGTGTVNITAAQDISITETDLTTGLVSHWSLDEGSGTTAYDQAGNYDGMFTGTPTWSSADPLGLEDSSSLDFNPHDRVSIGDNIDFGTGNFSISLFFNTSSSSAFQSLVAKSSGGSPRTDYGFLFGLNNARPFFATASAGGGWGSTGTYLAQSSNGALLNDSQYHSMVVVGDRASSNVRLYVDGDLYNLNTIQGNFSTVGNISNALNFVLGGESDGDFSYTGNMDDVRIYNTALYAEQVAQINSYSPEWQSGTVNMSAGRDMVFDLQGKNLGLGNNNNATLSAGRDIKTDSAGTLETAGSGNIQMTAGNDIDFTHDFDLDAAGSGSVILRADNNIIFSGGGDITTHNNKIELNADRDDTDAGSISMGAGTVLSSSGGAIILGGGADPSVTEAKGTNTYTQGIALTNSILDAGGGNIILRGNGNPGSTANSSDTSAHGVYINNSTIETSATGTIRIEGTGGGTGAGGSNVGVYIRNNGLVQSDTGDIYITGTTGGGSSGYNAGIALSSSGTNSIRSSSGDLHIYGVSGSTGNDPNHAIAVNSGGYNFDTAGAINITGIVSGGNGFGIGGQMGARIGSGLTSGDIHISTDSFSSGFDDVILTTLGTAYIAPQGNNTHISIADNNGGLSISSEFLNNISASGIVIGRSDGDGNIVVSTQNWNTPLTIMSRNGDISISGAQTLGHHSALIRTVGTGNIILGMNGSLSSTATGNAITLAAQGNFINNSTIGNPLSTANGRWLVYSTDPALNTRGSLMPDTSALFNARYDTNAPATIAAGNRFIFDIHQEDAPTLIFTADNNEKIYGASNPVFSYTVSGYLNGDGLSTAFNGNPLFSTTAGSNIIGTYQNAITGTQGTLGSYLGYNFDFVSGDLNITPAALIITARNVEKPYGTIKVFSGNEFEVSGLQYNDTVTSTTIISAGSLINAAASNTPYHILISDAVGTGLDNYNITYNYGSLLIPKVDTPFLPDTIIEPSKSMDLGTINNFAGPSSSPPTLQAPQPALALQKDNNGYSSIDSGKAEGALLLEAIIPDLVFIDPELKDLFRLVI